MEGSSADRSYSVSDGNGANGFFYSKRLYILGIFVLCASLCVTGGYLRLALAAPQQHAQESRLVQRGSIVDRNGKPLAVQQTLYHFVVTPSAIKDVGRFARSVAPALGQSEENVRAAIRGANPNFLYLAKKIDQSQYEDLRRVVDVNNYTFVRFDRISGRYYPENDLASQMIGFMGDEGRGLSGIEYSQESVLSPAAGSGLEPDMAGKNIYLTIDANLQHKLTKVMEDAQRDTQAESLMLIAAEAKTGEILSYISLPSANLNMYGAASKEEVVDRPAVTAYEPGSVFKIFSVATFLDAGVISESETFYCDGRYERKLPSGETIRINCLEHHGLLTARDALKYSCNDALAQMSDKITTEGFLQGIRRLGFGSRTGIELPSETPGKIKSPDDETWSARTKPTMSIGQELTVSALQMVEAATALANGGRTVQITCISKITDRDGNTEYVHRPQSKGQVLSPLTAGRILSYMETTAQSGTGTRAKIGDISIGVKTGTAQMADPVNGGYSDTDFLSNCIAAFPVENPEVILYIVIEKAKGETFAGRIVAPVIAEAADIIIDHLGMTRAGGLSLAHSGRISIDKSRFAQLGATVPDFRGISKRELLPLAERKDIQLRITGEGHVVSQRPEPGTAVRQGMTIELTLE